MMSLQNQPIGLSAFFRSFLAMMMLAACAACERAPIPPSGEKSAESAQSDRSQDAPNEGALINAPQAVEGESYRLVLHRIQPSAPQTDDGAAAERFALTLEGRGRWKVNEDFPINLTLAADPSIELSAKNLDKDGAVRFEEEGARFEFDAQGGEGRVNASLRFAMCVPESCTFHNETLGIKLASR